MGLVCLRSCAFRAVGLVEFRVSGLWAYCSWDLLRILGVLRFEALGLSLGLFGVGQDAGLELGAL